MKLSALILSLLVFLPAFAGETTFVFAHINESIMPIDRGKKYEDPLDTFLKSKAIGKVTGGGSMQSKTGEIEWVGVDMELTNPQKNIPAVVQKIRELGAPSGSFLEYKFENNSYKVTVK